MFELLTHYIFVKQCFGIDIKASSFFNFSTPAVTILHNFELLPLSEYSFW